MNRRAVFFAIAALAACAPETDPPAWKPSGGDAFTVSIHFSGGSHLTLGTAAEKALASAGSDPAVATARSLNLIFTANVIDRLGNESTAPVLAVSFLGSDIRAAKLEKLGPSGILDLATKVEAMGPAGRAYLKEQCGDLDPPRFCALAAAGA